MKQYRLSNQNTYTNQTCKLLWTINRHLKGLRKAVAICCALRQVDRPAPPLSVFSAFHDKHLLTIVGDIITLDVWI